MRVNSCISTRKLTWLYSWHSRLLCWRKICWIVCPITTYTGIWERSHSSAAAKLHPHCLFVRMPSYRSIKQPIKLHTHTHTHSHTLASRRWRPSNKKLRNKHKLNTIAEPPINQIIRQLIMRPPTANQIWTTTPTSNNSHPVKWPTK